MLNFITRKIYFKKFNAKQKYILELLVDSFRMDFIASVILFSVLIFPCITAVATLLTGILYGNLSIDDILAGIFFTILSLALILFFLVRFKYEVECLKFHIRLNLYSSYLYKGNALSKEDFDVIKEENKSLYNAITEFKASGYCYGICFEILKALKKGKILFVAIKDLDAKRKKDYTMHVLYVNNDWCYDTYSQKQHPLDYALNHFYAIEYTSFSYDDIKEKNYHEFRKENSAALKIWCEENDCYEEWSDFSQK